MATQVQFSGIKNITVSGRIASGTTTLARALANTLSWNLLEGGALFEKFHKELKLSEIEVLNRPDELDLQYEEKIISMLSDNSQNIIQSHLAGFDAQRIDGVFKILIECVDADGTDKTEIRIDRLANRRGISIDEAKEEVLTREKNNLEKWRKLYANGDNEWVYWDKKYYDLVINTYDHNQEQTLTLALEAVGYQEQK